ncbi:hypothetical protein PtA15_8A226 [Puccinia triticina]|uniref:Uncharacterized protein n=1 Tax=Puccinia triticina TaxID=208348 RepID=A0ABY7CS65_9BASI|nr:uncharacterized protein PtA15_8A226 [Puccinia triticina]WAQ87322.1 hypothetical protein PtA15_8A226 [Puccinia triticina]
MGTFGGGGYVNVAVIETGATTGGLASLRLISIYAALVRSNGRLKGAPKILFDIAQGPSESGKKRAYTWPMMAMHLSVCPNIVLKITVGNRNRSQVTARRPPSFVPSGRGPPVQHTGHLLHELNSRLASAAEINPDDLEMFMYLPVLLLNNQNPRPIQQAVMTVLRAYHQPSSAPTRPPGNPSCTLIPWPRAPPWPQTDPRHIK